MVQCTLEMTGMRFLVRLKNQRGVTPADRRKLSRAAYEEVRGFGADVGNLRVSSSAIEFDLLLESEDNLQKSLKILEEKMGPLLTLRKLDVQTSPIPNEEAIALGLDLFNEERYWESHEALESAWKKAEGDEKEVLQGLILLAAALVHWQKNEKLVTLNVMKRAYDKLASRRTKRFGVDIASLNDKLEKMLTSGAPEFLKLELVEAQS